MVVTTRRATPGDAEAVALAHTRGWQVGYRGLVPDSILDAIDLEQRTAQWRQNLAEENPADFVAEVDGQVVGFACVGPFRTGEASDSCDKTVHLAAHGSSNFSRLAVG